MASSEDIDCENWVAKLPESLHRESLNRICIPGSHNSFAFFLDKSGDISPDAADAVKGLAAFFGALAKDIVHRWSITQTLDVENQLRAGVRYFDVRVSARPGSDDAYVVHGLYGHKVDDCLQSLAAFLETHPKEVVLLDFNHFHCMDKAAHDKLLQQIVSRFSSKLCPPVMNISEVTLEMLWQKGYQVLLFYHHTGDAGSTDWPKLWPGSRIPAPWHNTANTACLMQRLEQTYSQCVDSPRESFLVMQGVLTPDTAMILGNMTSSLKNVVSANVCKTFVNWLVRQEPKSAGVNILCGLY